MLNKLKACLRGILVTSRHAVAEVAERELTASRRARLVVMPTTSSGGSKQACPGIRTCCSNLRASR